VHDIGSAHTRGVLRTEPEARAQRDPQSRIRFTYDCRAGVASRCFVSNLAVLLHHVSAASNAPEHQSATGSCSVRRGHIASTSLRRLLTLILELRRARTVPEDVHSDRHGVIESPATAWHGPSGRSLADTRMLEIRARSRPSAPRECAACRACPRLDSASPPGPATFTGGALSAPDTSFPATSLCKGFPPIE
jgi:hypothetical protein